MKLFSLLFALVLNGWTCYFLYQIWRTNRQHRKFQRLCDMHRILIMEAIEAKCRGNHQLAIDRLDECALVLEQAQAVRMR